MSFGIPLSKEHVADIRRSCEPVQIFGQPPIDNPSVCLPPFTIIALCDTVEALRAAVHSMEKQSVVSDERTDLSKALEHDHAEIEAAHPADADYTGDPCAFCGRIRVFVRKDGQRQCEKCEQIQPGDDRSSSK